MNIVEPKRTETKVWIGQFNKQLMLWLQGQRGDLGVFREGMAALRHALEREPAVAGYVANLVSTLLRQHGDLFSAEAVEEFARMGLDAVDLVREPSILRTRTACDLRTKLANARLQQMRPAEAIEQAAITIAELDALAPADFSIDRLLEGQARLVRARAFESLVEYRLALADYERAAAIAASHQALEGMFEILRGLVELDFPGTQVPEEVIRAENQLIWRALCVLAIGATVGAGRCAVFAQPKSADAWLQSIAKVAGKNGLADVQPLELMPIVQSASPAAAKRFVDMIAAAAQKLGLDGNAFEAALGAAMVPGIATKKGRNALRIAAQQAADRSGDPLIEAAVAGVLLVDDEDASNRPKHLQVFTDRIEELSESRDARLAEPATRFVFERPVTMALAELVPANGGELPWDERSRALVARLIDYDFSGLTPLEAWLGPSSLDSDALVRAARLARDHLARIRSAIRDWGNTVAVIVRSTGSRTVFIAFSAERPAASWVTDGGYDAKARALAEKVRVDTTALVAFGALPNVAGLLGAARAAYDAMPTGLRALIANSERLLVLPDPDLREGEMPFELLHDGESWLGAKKIVARFPTLRALIRCLERTSSRDTHSRFLGLAFPEAPGFDALKFARTEVEAVRERLATLGWDAPKLGDEQLPAAYILDLLPHAQHFHIASHGARDEGADAPDGAANSSQESIVLPSGKLPSHALIARFFPRMPTAFINACELGFARWVGAGRTQSMAYAFVSAGSPTVIANLLPAEDRTAARLAEIFYGNLESQDFGSSLRFARKALADEGMHPLLWATVVLAGDPTNTLARRASAAGPCEAYLKALVENQPAQARQAAVEGVRAQLARDQDDVRLRAALALFDAMGSKQWQSGPAPERTVAEMCKVAYEIGYLPLLGYLVEVGRSFTSDKGRDFRLRYLDNAIRVFESLRDEHPVWVPRLDAALVEWFKLERGDRVQQQLEQASQVAKAIAEVKMALHARQLRAGRGPIPRRVESTADDVVWNAVIANYRFYLEDMREKTDIARDAVARLVERGAIPADCAVEATLGFAGLLQWLWISQDVLVLEQQMVEGQCGVVKELVAALQERWTTQKWFEPLRDFETFLLDAVQRIEAAPYDERLQSLIERTFAEITARAKLAVEKAQSAGHGCEGTAGILGMLMVYNGYSFTGGSVDEDLDRRLVRVVEVIASEAQSRFAPWLDRGFKSVREWVPDLLWKWENDVAAKPAKTAKGKHTSRVKT